MHVYIFSRPGVMWGEVMFTLFDTDCMVRCFTVVCLPTKYTSHTCRATCKVRTLYNNVQYLIHQCRGCVATVGGMF